MTHSGRCACGQLRFTADADPIGARMCWCRDCQRIACGSATVNVIFPGEAVAFSGQIARRERIADSGNKTERGFCPDCGSQIYARMLDPAGPLTVIRAGVLDDPDLIAPQMVIWTSSAPRWATLDPALPHYPKGAPQ